MVRMKITHPLDVGNKEQCRDKHFEQKWLV